VWLSIVSSCTKVLVIGGTAAIAKIVARKLKEDDLFHCEFIPESCVKVNIGCIGESIKGRSVGIDYRQFIKRDKRKNF
jgi:hypothetical protein